VILGAGLHFIVQAPSLYRAGFRWRPILDFGDRAFRNIVRLMIPRTIGLASGQINLIVLNSIASTIAVGSITIITFANNLWILPVSLIGISISTAVFPSLSDLSASNERRVFDETLVKIMKQMIFLALPATVMMILFRNQIIDVLLGAGLFTLDNVRLTAAAVGIFALGVIPFSLEQLVNRAFYALHHTGIPVVASIVADVVNVVVALLLVKYAHNSFLTPFFHLFLSTNDPTSLKILGLAFAFSFANLVNFVVLWIGFRWYTKTKETKPLLLFLSKLILASALSVVGVLAVRSIGVNDPFLPMFVFKLAYLLVYMLLFSTFFFLFSALLKVDELKDILHKALRG
jgi:putative peptidoglycan lipid II flippase